MTFLLTTHIRPILEYCSCLWHTGYITDLRLLEGVQRRWTKHIDGMSMLSYAERLHALQLFSVKGRLLRADLIYCWKLFNGKCSLSVEDLFQLSTHTLTLEVTVTRLLSLLVLMSDDAFSLCDVYPYETHLLNSPVRFPQPWLRKEGNLWRTETRQLLRDAGIGYGPELRHWIKSWYSASAGRCCMCS